MIERPIDLTTELGRLFMREGTRAMLIISQTMEAMAGRGEAIPPELIEAFQKCSGVVKTAVDHVLPVAKED